jgi:hypothetical protein
MKKLILIAFITITLFNFSCSDNENTNPLEHPISGMMADSTATHAGNSAGLYEIGYTFKSSKKGKLTQFGLDIPRNGGTFYVTLWNTDTKAKIAQTKVSTKGHEKKYQNITPVTIEPNVVYMISYTTANISNPDSPVAGPYYIYRSVSDIYPVTKNNITVVNNWEIGVNGNPVPTYPTDGSCDSCIVGTVDFTFQAD